MSIVKNKKTWPGPFCAKALVARKEMIPIYEILNSKYVTGSVGHASRTWPVLGTSRVNHLTDFGGFLTGPAGRLNIVFTCYDYPSLIS